MNLIDVIIILPLLWALYNGFRKGIMPQVGGLVGILLGVFIAYYLGVAANKWLNVTSPSGKIATFIVLVGLTLFFVTLAARMISGAFNAAGLGIFNQLGGAILCFVKIGVVISLLLLGFQWLNDRKHMVGEQTLSNSKLYYPMIELTAYAFPYVNKAVDSAREKIGEWDEQNQQKAYEEELERQRNSVPGSR